MYEVVKCSFFNPEKRKNGWRNIEEEREKGEPSWPRVVSWPPEAWGIRNVHVHRCGVWSSGGSSGRVSAGLISMMPDMSTNSITQP